MNTPTGQIEDTDRRWWVMLAEWAAYHWRRLHPHRDDLAWPPRWAPTAAVLDSLVLVLGIVVPVVRAFLHLAWAAIRGGAGLLHDTGAVRIVLDPVHTYLDRHAVGLPLSAATLWWTWCATGVLLLVSAAGRVTAARVGWVLYGAATTAMVWQTTAPPGKPIATALTVLWWTLGSLPALRRSTRIPQVIARIPDLSTLASILRPRGDSD